MSRLSASIRPKHTAKMKRTIRMSIRRTSSRVALAFLVLGFAACEGETVEEEPVVRPVRYGEVIATGGNRIRVFSGVTRAGSETALSFRIAGTVERVDVLVGNEVRRGQSIAELDVSDYVMELDYARANLAQAEAQERNSAASYERVLGLYENDNASRADLDAARASLESATASVRAGGSQVQLARRRVGYGSMRAPIDGSIAQVRITVNENVNPGTTVVVMTSGDLPEVEVAVPEVLIARVRERSTVDVTFDALPGRSFAATITEVGVASTQSATTYPVTVRLNLSDPDIRPGMASEVAIPFEVEGDVLRIYVPAEGVGEDRDGRFVFVLEQTGEDEGVAQRRKVVLGDITQDGIEIQQGVQEGELIATAGVNRLIDGQRVRLLEN